MAKNAPSPHNWNDPQVAQLCELLSDAIAKMAEQTKTDRYIYLVMTGLVLTVTMGMACFLVMRSGEDKIIMGVISAILGGTGGGVAAGLTIKIMRIWDGYLALYRSAIAKVATISIGDGFEFVHQIIKLMLSQVRVERTLFLIANALYLIVLAFVMCMIVYQNRDVTATNGGLEFILIILGTSAGAGGVMMTTGRMLTVWNSYRIALQDVINKQGVADVA